MSTRKLKPLPKLILVGVAVLTLISGLRFGVAHGFIPSVGIMKAIVPSKVNLPTVRDSDASANVTAAPLPTDRKCNDGQPIPAEIWAWNSQMGWIYANGGPETTCDSLMKKHGVYMTIKRQDSVDQMKNDLVACAKELKDGAQACTSGVAFVAIMGDGAAQFLAGLNPELKKLGAEYQAEVVGSAGYSRGEDKFMAPPEVKASPQKAKGILVSGVIRDGDWNIALKWAGDNGIKNNPDEKTWDPDAINWVNAPDNDFLKAAEQYNSGYCEDRKVVKNGSLTGETKNVCVNGVVTWTPGDVNIAHGRGGLVSVVSTKEYRAQMPNAIIGIKKFNAANSDKVAGMLAAILEGGDQLKAFPQALEKAAELSAKVYNEGTGKYWLTYFKGTKERDKHGNEVELGGSAVNNLADELTLFGLIPGTNNNFKSTYTVFGNLVKEQYPKLVPEYPDYKDAVNTAYIRRAQDLIESGATGEADVAKFSESDSGGALVSRRSYYITFATGSAEIVGDGVRTMEDLKDGLAIAGGTYIRVDGYTDNTGSPETNRLLSEARARAIKQYLQRRAPANFPDGRFRVAGHGPDNPVADNGTSAGRSKNRRVEITLTAG